MRASARSSRDIFRQRTGIRRESREREGHRERKRATEKEGGRDARTVVVQPVAHQIGPLIPFKGEARRKYIVVHRVGESRAGRERQGGKKREGKRKIVTGSRRDALEEKGSSATTGVCGSETEEGKEVQEKGRLKEAHCLPSEADNSVMNVTDARPRSGL